MEYTGFRYFNSFYVKTPEAVFKIVELIIGAGAWGSIILIPVYTSGPFSFYLWCTFSSWILVLLTYLLGLCKLSKCPQNGDEWRRYCAPNLGDLILTAAIAVTYIPAIIVFAVNSFPSSALSTGAVFVIVMAVLTFVIHALHAATLALYFIMGDSKWKTEKRWFWQKSGNAGRSAPSTRPSKYEEPVPQSSSGYENPTPTPAKAPVDAEHEIYQDVS